jgi:hypothetical protein
MLPEPWVKVIQYDGLKVLDAVISNVRGPEKFVTIGNSKLNFMAGYIPLGYCCPMAVAWITYDGKGYSSIACDPKALGITAHEICGDIERKILEEAEKES